MRKLITVVALFGLVSTTFAQTETETLSWLKTNVKNLDHVNCPTINLYGSHLEITDESVRLFDENSSCKIKWNDVTDVTKKGEFFYLLTNKTIENKPLELKFYVHDTNTTDQFVKALHKMAEFKSSQIVKNDLF